MVDTFRVLVVDDEKDFVETLVTRLKGRDVDATGVTSGEEAIELLKRNPFDVVILDIRMPGSMDGISALSEMKKVRPRTEVILLTGHATVESSIQGLEQGAFDFLVKPVQMEELIVKMAQALERKDAHEQKIRTARIRDLMRFPGRAGRD